MLAFWLELVLGDMIKGSGIAADSLSQILTSVLGFPIPCAKLEWFESGATGELIKGIASGSGHSTRRGALCKHCG